MVDFNIFKGDLFKYTLTVKESGSAVDITGYKFYMTVKSDKDDIDTAAAIKKEFDPSDPDNGVVIIQLDSSETDDLTVTTSTTKYVYDIRMKDASGEDTVLLSGELKVLQPITRSTSV